jgi:hypothetical protein
MDDSSVAHLFRSVMDLMQELRPGQVITFERLCDLHTEFKPDLLREFVRFLENQVFLSRQERTGHMSLWPTQDGIAAARTYTEAQWRRLAREFLRGR